MKRIIGAGLALALVVGVLAAPPAEAGLFKKKKPKRTEMPEWMKEPKRFEDTPRMGFVAGTLERDGWSGWKVGDMSLQFSKNCRFTSGGVELTDLDPGSEVLVMGPRIGTTLVAWSVRVQQPDFMVGRNVGNETQLLVSEANPDCGEVIQAPQ